MVLIAGSLDLNAIVNWQDRHVWGIVVQPLGFLLFLVSAFAETNRLPFDLPESRAGAGRRLPHRVLGDEVRHVLPRRIPARDHGQLPDGDPLLRRLGHPVRARPGPDRAGSGAVLKVLVLLVKVALMILFIMWVRWTLPRFRYDQLMDLAWKSLIPLALVNLVVTAAIVQLFRG